MIHVALADVLTSATSGYWGKAPGESDVDVQVIRNGDVKPGRGVLWSALPRRGFRAAEADKSLICSGDLLLTTSGDCGVVAMVERPPASVTCASNFIRILRVDPRAVDPRYLFHFMQTRMFLDALRPFVRGSTIQNLSTTSAFPEVKVPLPPLEEQRRIAAILDRAGRLQDLHGAGHNEFEGLVRAIYLSMFGPTGSFVAQCQSSTLNDLVSFKSGKFLPASRQRSGSYPVYGGNGVNGTHDEFMFPSPVIAVGRVGAYCGAVHLTKPNSWVTDNALYVSATSRDMSLEFLASLLHEARLNQYANQSGQPLISNSRIASVEVQVPPYDLQKEYERRVSSASIHIDRWRRTDRALADLLASLHARAFSGQL